MKTLFDLAHTFYSCFEHNFRVCERLSTGRKKASTWRISGAPDRAVE